MCAVANVPDKSNVLLSMISKHDDEGDVGREGSPVCGGASIRQGAYTRFGIGGSTLLKAIRVLL